jgi:peptidoglycan hydrolase-like protein with peptidoglycan-binding domain
MRALGYFSGAIDGVFGAQTEAAVIALQEAEALTADGVVGPATWTVLELPVLRRGDRGDRVRQLQQRLQILGFLSGAVDGVFGSETEAAVKALQEDADITVDGIVGPTTWNALAR